MRERCRRWALSCLLLAGAVSHAGAQRLHVETFSVDDGLPTTHLLDLAQESSGRLWIAGRAGLTVYDGQSFETMTPRQDRATDVFSALDLDAGGTIWAVTRSYPQVFYFRSGSTWQSLPGIPAPADGVHWAYCLEVLAGRRVAVGSTHGLELWDGESWSRLGPAGLHVTSLATLGGTTFAGTISGLCTLAGRDLDCRTPEDEPRLKDQILALHPERDRPRLWLLARSWLGYLDNGELTVAADGLRQDSADPDIPAAIAVDRAGGVYFGSPARLYFLPPGGGPVSKLGLAEGLVDEGTTALLVDREDNVWVGGLRGLSRIESRRFRTFDRDQALLENEVTALVEPAPGSFVLGHNAGTTFFDGQRVETVAFDIPSAVDRYASVRVLDLAVDGEGGVWAAARTLGVLRLTAGRRWTPALDIDAFAVETDARGRLWALSPTRLFRRDGDRFTPVVLGFEEANKRYRWLDFGPDGRLYVSTAHGVIWQDGESWTWTRGPDSASENVYNVLADAEGNVWAGTAGGLYELRDGALVKTRRGALAVDRPIYLLFADAEGRLWIGTDDGVYVWDGRDLRHFSVGHGLAGREANRGAGLVDHSGRAWIGTDRGVSVYDQRYDLRPRVAPNVEIRGVEVEGELRPLAAGLELGHRQNTLTFQLRPIFFWREERVLYRYRLESFDPAWQGPSPLPGSEIRYTNLPPGRYRLRVAARWAGGPWSEEAVSAPVVIAAPFWRRPWFIGLAIAALVVTVYGAFTLRTRAIRSRARELAALNVELRENITRRERVEAERERLIAELEARNAELERFTYTVSHDLKAPLVTVRGFVGLLAKDLDAGTVAEARRDLEHIDDAAERMKRLLDELLSLSRVGRVVNPSEHVAVGDLAREVTGAIDLGAVAVDIAPDLPVVLADRTRLSEVLQNLVENAVRYMGDQPAPRIEIGARRGGGETVIYVRDNGTGIEPRYHEKIFGLFERLDTTTDGTGVGLALVKRIVETHGGRIWVESEGAGRGSTFCFTLPG